TGWVARVRSSLQSACRDQHRALYRSVSCEGCRVGGVYGARQDLHSINHGGPGGTEYSGAVKATGSPCDESMKILHVLESFSPRFGGPVSVLKGLVCAQADAGHEVTVCTTNLDYPGGILRPAGK